MSKSEKGWYNERVKELKGKYGRPDWNPAVKITFEGTKCLALNIEEAVNKLGFEDGDEFIRYAIRNQLDEYGIKHFLKSPEDEPKKEETTPRKPGRPKGSIEYATLLGGRHLRKYRREYMRRYRREKGLVKSPYFPRLGGRKDRNRERIDSIET